MRCFYFIALFLSTCLSSVCQIIPVTISNRLNSEVDINVKIEEMHSSKLTAICFLDSTDIGFVNVNMELKAKAIESQSQVAFLIVKFSSRIPDSESIQFYGNKILESQFYINSNVFQITDAANYIFEMQQGKLPSRIKKVDLSKCLKDKKLTTYVVSFLFPAIEESMKLVERYSKDIAIMVGLEAVTAFSKDIQSEQLINRHQIDSLQKIVRELDVKIRKLEDLVSSSNLKNKSHIELLCSSISLIPDLNNRLISSRINFSSSKNSNFYLSLGYSNIHKRWSSSVGGYSNLVKAVNAENDFDISITGRDIKDRIDLNVHSFTLGFKCEGPLAFGMDFFIPVASELTSENISGVFNYVGMKSDILEPLLDIPELGLQSNVSYKGQVQRYINVMKPSVMFNLGIPIKMGERMKLKPSLNYIISRKFKNIQSNDELTPQMGSYNGLIQYSDYANKPCRSLLFGLGLILDIN
jgi:hypothetical protein